MIPNIHDLKFQYRQDYTWIKAYTRLINQGKAICRGFVDDQDKKKGEKLFNEILAGNPNVPVEAFALTQPLIEAYEIIHDYRDKQEKVLVKEGKKLPYAAEVLKVRGLAPASYARIIAEAGPLTDYANPAKLWKRFGLAVMSDGERQRKCSDAEKALEHGYSPRRRAVMAVIMGNVCLKSGDPYYRALYDREKERQLTNGLYKKHAHDRALRYCAKRLLLNIWRIWHGQEILS